MNATSNALMESFDLKEGLYRQQGGDEVVDVLNVGLDFDDTTKRVVICRRLKIDALCILPVEDFCMEFVPVLGGTR